MWLVVAIGILVVLDLMSIHLGVDSRDGNDWIRHRGR